MGYVPVLRAEVEVVHRQRLLEDRRVRALRDRHQHRIDVAHVVAADDVRAVGQALRMACRWPSAAAARRS